MKRHVFALPEPPFACGLRHMAIRAPHLALGTFFSDGLPGEPGGTHVADVLSFVSQMIELKHQRISLAAVHAGVSRQVLPYAKSVLFGGPVAHDSNMLDVFLAIA